jgi:hypothetical protein
MLDLAPLPREQIGPFLLLGVAKEATKEQIEENWSLRVIWARRNTLKVPLEDVNWARDVMNDKDKRMRADVASLNLDACDSLVRTLVRRYTGGTKGALLWQALDCEKPLADYEPPADVPTIESVRSALVVPELPEDVPAVTPLIRQLAQANLDPWNLEFPS